MACDASHAEGGRQSPPIVDWERMGGGNPFNEAREEEEDCFGFLL